jgi:hypothetical protein
MSDLIFKNTSNLFPFKGMIFLPELQSFAIAEVTVVDQVCSYLSCRCLRFQNQHI